MPGTLQPPTWLLAVIAFTLCLVLAAWTLLIARRVEGKPMLPRRGRRRVPWGPDGAVLAGLYLFGAALSLAVDPAATEATRQSGLSLSAVFLHAMVFFAFTGVAIGWLASNYSVRPVDLSDFGLGGSSADWLFDLPLGVLAAAAMLPIVYAVNVLLIGFFGDPTVHPAIKSLLESPRTETLIAASVMAVVLAPVFEELAFRVLLQGWLERLSPRGSWLPIVLSSVVFGLAHTNQGFAQAPIMVLALGLGYLYRQTHSYPAVVGMHAAFNALSLAVAIGAGPLIEP